MQVTVKRLIVKGNLLSRMTTSILLDYHYLSKGLRLRKQTSTESTDAQGKTSNHLDFILTRLSISLW